jgi:hypothetical protein
MSPVAGMRFLPRPVQRPGVPVWVAGYYGNPSRCAGQPAARVAGRVPVGPRLGRPGPRPDPRPYPDTTPARLDDTRLVTVDEVRTVSGDACDVRCREAEGDDCSCRCLGLYHGEGLPRVGWVLVGETTLQQRPERVRVRWQVRREDLARGRRPYRQGAPRHDWTNPGPG